MDLVQNNIDDLVCSEELLDSIDQSANDLNVDMLTTSAHKFNGPKGIGFIYIKKGVNLNSHLAGGSPEKGRRAGTEDVASIVGMATTLR